MIFKDVHIHSHILSFFQEHRHQLTSLATANDFLYATSGILQFFSYTADLEELQRKVAGHTSRVEEPERREYGDFQTNHTLANQVVTYLGEKNAHPTFILEPTCGKGRFIIASLMHFTTIKKIVGVEIYQPYVWETKFHILSFFIQHPRHEKPDIEIIHANVFEFPFDILAQHTKQFETLIIGNPPWVTNAELSSIDSNNLPPKSNFKQHIGLEAITGKGNFDIGEYISLLMLKNFSGHTGFFSFLLKNSVVKNIIYEQEKTPYRIGNIERLHIHSKKEFNVSVGACLFLAELNQEPQYLCQDRDFYTLEPRTRFGWHAGKFVYSVSDYGESSDIDGESQFIWRQGMKHDCAKIMELEKCNGHYVNGQHQEIELEPDLLYGLLKSSDLKQTEITTYRKLVIVTQQRIGQDTHYIQRKFPLTFTYLNQHHTYFEKRKSTIYKGKPRFSIFGIGEYAFTPFKVAISGLYKRTHFTLVIPEQEKPMMLDDTCYFIGFEQLAYAQIAHFLLNHPHTQRFLKSIIFPDAKRSITKDVLMRIDFRKIYGLIDFDVVQEALQDITRHDWISFGELVNKTATTQQMALF